MGNSRNNRVLYILWSIICIDLMCLPVLPVIHLPISIVIIAFLFIANSKRIVCKISILEIVLYACIVLSVIFSLVTKESTAIINNGVINSNISVHLEDIKRASYLLIAALYYMVSYWIIFQINSKYENRVTKHCIEVTIIFTIALYALFLNNYPLYSNIRDVIFRTSVDVSSSTVLNASGYLYRYQFILLDPNNACYLMLTLGAYFICVCKPYGIMKYVAWLVMLVMPFATQCTGGIYAFIAFLIVYLFFSARKGNLRINSFIIGLYAIAFIAFLIIAANVINIPLISNIINSQSSVLERWKENSMNGRFQIYKYVIDNIPLKIMGNGHTLVKNGYAVFPHSDHLRIMYAYGIIAYIIVVVICISKIRNQKEYLFLMPVFIATALNSLIDENRYLYVVCILLATINARRDKNIVHRNEINKEDKGIETIEER